MDTQTAGAWMRRVRGLLRKRLLTAHDLAVADALVWCCRTPGQGRAIVPYKKLAKLAGVSKPTAVQAVSRLAKAGMITPVARRVRAGWRRLVAANLYLFVIPNTESKGLPTTQGLRKTRSGKVCPFEGSALDLALKRLYETMGEHPA